VPFNTFGCIFSMWHIRMLCCFRTFVGTYLDNGLIIKPLLKGGLYATALFICLSPEMHGLTGTSALRPLTAYCTDRPGVAAAYQCRPFGLHWLVLIVVMILMVQIINILRHSPTDASGTHTLEVDAITLFSLVQMLHVSHYNTNTRVVP